MVNIPTGLILVQPAYIDELNVFVLCLFES